MANSGELRTAATEMQMEDDADDASPAVEPMTDDTNIVLQVARCLCLLACGLMASGLRLNVFAVVGNAHLAHLDEADVISSLEITLKLEGVLE